MNSFINTVTSNPSSYTVPSVTYNSTINQVRYQHVSRITSNKAEAKAGDIVLCYDTNVLFVDPYSYLTHSYRSTDSWEVYCAVGIVVVPSSHSGDGTVRIMSLKYMDYNNPGSGSDSKVNIVWGNANTNLSLTDYDQLVTIVPGTSTTSTDSYSYLPTNFHRYKFTENTIDRGTFYSQGADLDNIYSPSPYLANGAKSTIYHQSGQGFSDMNGSSNTDIIISAVTATWSGDNISNSSSTGNHPAACCCRRYYIEDLDSSNEYFGEGCWYLPSIGELGYLCARFEEIDRSRRILGKDSLWGSYYWSSTEYGQDYAWNLSLSKYLNFGNVNHRTKTYNYSVLAFCSF
jgi:hypothetical protein